MMIFVGFPLPVLYTTKKKAACSKATFFFVFTVISIVQPESVLPPHSSSPFAVTQQE